MKKCANVWFISLCLLAAFSCNKNEPAPDCGCDTPTMTTVQNVPAAYQGNGYFNVVDTTAYQRIYIVLACEIDPAWVVKEGLEPNYTISGRIKNKCPFFEGIPLIPSYLISDITIDK